MKFNLNLDNINYIKLVYKDKDNNPRCTKAAIKSLGEHEIYACAKFDNDFSIKTPQNISLSFICDNGLYRTTTTLKYIQKEEPYIFFTLETPESLDYQQNREYFRVRLYEDVIIAYTYNEQAKKVITKTYDISANGIRIELTEPVTFPEEVVVNILFPKRNITTKARFIRTDDEDDILKASFNFIDLSEKDIDMISQICIQKQLEYKRSKM